MLTLRLARAGTKKRPFYHLVATDSRNPRDGRFREKLGYYHPGQKTLVFDQDRIQYWLGVGAQTSSSASRLIKYAKKHGNSPLPKKGASAKAPEAPKAAPAPVKAAEKKPAAPKEAAPTEAAKEAEPPKEAASAKEGASGADPAASGAETAAKEAASDKDPAGDKA